MQGRRASLVVRGECVSDERMRRLERAAATGDMVAQSQLDIAKKRLGKRIRPIHFPDSKREGVTACGREVDSWGGPGALLLQLSTDGGTVTCGVCRRTRACRGRPPVTEPRIHYWVTRPGFAGACEPTAGPARVLCSRGSNAAWPRMTKVRAEANPFGVGTRSLEEVNCVKCLSKLVKAGKGSR